MLNKIISNSSRPKKNFSRISEKTPQPPPKDYAYYPKLAQVLFKLWQSKRESQHLLDYFSALENAYRKKPTFELAMEILTNYYNHIMTLSDDEAKDDLQDTLIIRAQNFAQSEPIIEFVQMFYIDTPSEESEEPYVLTPNDLRICWKKDAPFLLNTLAHKSIYEHEYAKGIALSVKALELDPTNPYSLHNLGGIFLIKAQIIFDDHIHLTRELLDICETYLHTSLMHYKPAIGYYKSRIAALLCSAKKTRKEKDCRVTEIDLTKLRKAVQNAQDSKTDALNYQVLVKAELYEWDGVKKEISTNIIETQNEIESSNCELTRAVKIFEDENTETKLADLVSLKKELADSYNTINCLCIVILKQLDKEWKMHKLELMMSRFSLIMLKKTLSNEVNAFNKLRDE